MDLLFVRLLAAGAVTARGTEEAPELAHHVREGGVVGRHGGSGEALGQRVQHGVWCVPAQSPLVTDLHTANCVLTEAGLVSPLWR